jgi:hypothetical protein
MGWSDVTDWVAGLVFIYAGLFAVGKLLLHSWASGSAYALLAAAAGWFVWRSVRRAALA